MARDSKSFPITRARKFTESKGLVEAVECIEGLEQPKGWKNDLRGFKKGKYIMLFCAHGLFEEFKQKHWPQEGAPDNYHGKLVYIARALT